MACWFIVLDITFLAGDDLFMKLVAAVVELFRLPIPQEDLADPHLTTQQHKPSLLFSTSPSSASGSLAVFCWGSEKSVSC